MSLSEAVGRYFLFRFRKRLETTNVRTVALQLKKQGVPLPIARLIVFGLRRELPLLTDVVQESPPERAP